jgi:lysophospholipase L1-like esterase
MSADQKPLSVREKVLAFVFFLVGTSLLVEVGFRAFGPDYYQFNNMFAEYTSNPRGYFDTLAEKDGQILYGIKMNTAVGVGGRRGADMSGRPSERILGLGDSQAQGQGVRFEDTMYEQLSTSLSKSGIKTSVRNASVSGYDLNEIVSRYAYETSMGTQYDLVLYAMVLDDYGLDRSQIEGLDFIQYQPGYTFDPWRARSAAWNFVAHTAEQLALSKDTSGAYLDSFRGENLKQKTEQLTRFSRQVTHDGGTLVVMVLPLLYDFENYPFGEIHQTLMQTASDNNIHMIDLLPVLQTEKAQDLWVHPTDHHPNERAHAMVAQALHRYLQDQGLSQTLKNR